MKRQLVGFSFALAVLALPHIASAQSLKEKLVGAYILAEGKKIVPWAKGSLQLSPTGRASFFVLPKERAKTDSVRTPAGPMVAWYGSYTVDEAANTFTVTVEGASSPVFEGAKRVQTISFQGDTMTLTGSKVDTPEGSISPVNVWKKVQAK
jgi:Lipocalin-like domain